MKEREVGNCYGMEEGKEKAHRTLLEIMYGEASRLPRSRCMSLAQGVVSGDMLTGYTV